MFKDFKKLNLELLTPPIEDEKEIVSIPNKAPTEETSPIEEISPTEEKRNDLPKPDSGVPAEKTETNEELPDGEEEQEDETEEKSGFDEYLEKFKSEAIDELPEDIQPTEAEEAIQSILSSDLPENEKKEKLVDIFSGAIEDIKFFKNKYLEKTNESADIIQSWLSLIEKGKLEEVERKKLLFQIDKDPVVKELFDKKNDAERKDIIYNYIKEIDWIDVRNIIASQKMDEPDDLSSGAAINTQLKTPVVNKWWGLALEVV